MCASKIAAMANGLLSGRTVRCLFCVGKVQGVKEIAAFPVSETAPQTPMTNKVVPK